MSINRSHLELRELRKLQWGLGLHLLNGPLTLEQIRNSCENNPFPYASQSGAFTTGIWRTRHLKRLPDDIAGLVRAGWVTQDGDRYALTPKGRERVNVAMGHALTTLHGLSGKLRSLVQPNVASKVTLAVQIVLAMIKLPAGLLSGSVGLLNDSLDTILDLLSSLLVYLGVRYDKERLVSILLVISMLATGAFTLYEAVTRFFTPYVPSVDWFPFAAAALSALAGLILWTYQRYVGLQTGLMAFITESVDSRNHVIVALGVTAGLVAALLHFGLLDMLVGLAVAALILWSAIELLVDLLRSSGSGQVNLSRYGFWVQDAYEHALAHYLGQSILELVRCGEARTRAELLERVGHAADFRDNPWLQAVGLDRQFAPNTAVERSLEQLIRCGWVIDREPLVLSEAGLEQFDKQRQHRGPIHESEMRP